MYRKNKSTQIPFNRPAIWTEATSHAFRECYFCSIERAKGKEKQSYFNCTNCTLPTATSALLKDFSDRSSDSEDEYLTDDNEYLPPSDNQSSMWSSSDFGDFCRELNLSKSASIKCLKMLKSDQDIAKKLSDIKICDIKFRNYELLDLFETNGLFTFCTNVNYLLERLSASALSKSWSLFIDSSKFSLKAALVCESHEYPTVPIVHARVKEDRSSVQRILDLLKYSEQNWPIVADLKVLNFLLGFPGGYSKHPCFYCFFDTRNSLPDFDKNFIWPARNVTQEEMVSPNNIIFPFLHIKLGLFQKFVKSLSQNGQCFQYLVQNSNKSEAKIQNGVYTGPEIRKLLKDNDFISTMTTTEELCWKSFSNLCQNVLGNNVSCDWSNIVDEFIQSMKNMGCTRMSNKMHLLYKHKKQYEKHLGKFSDEHGERLHKEMEIIETRYRPQLNREMLSDYIWSLKREGAFNFSTKKICFK